MRHNFLRLMGLMLVLMLVLSGCNLIGVDPIMQLEEDMAAKVKQYSAVVASYDGGEIKQADVMGNLSSQYSYMSQLYSMYGLSFTNDMFTNLEQSVVENAIEDVAIARQLEARGLSLSEEKLAEVQSSADETYQQAFDSFLSQAEGESDEVRAKQAEFDMYVNGYTKEAFYNMELASAKRELIEETVEAEISEVTDEELQAAFDEKVADDEETYSENPGAFESAMTGEDAEVYWVPEGYRTVKHILVIPEEDALKAMNDARNAYDGALEALEDLQAELDGLNDDDAGVETEEAVEAEPAEEPRTAEEIQIDINAAQQTVDSAKADAETAEAACLASVQDKLDEIYGKIEAGEDFNALIEAYGEDPGMQNEPTATRGYYVCADSTTWDQHFTNGAMALDNVGDITDTPVISASGVHIIRYESDVTSGPVALEDVKDALYEDTLQTMKSEHFDAELESWVTALNAVTKIDAFNLDD